MFKRLVFAFALAPLAACGGKASSTTADTTPKTAEVAQPAPSTIVELGEITVVQGTDAVLKVHASGATELGGTSNGQIVYQPGPTVKPDGTFASPNGKLGVKLGADGTLLDLTTNQKLPLIITADAVTITLDNQTAQITLAADGTLVVPGATGSATKVQGADTPGKRKLTLALIGLILLPSAPSATPAATSSSPATPPATTPPAATTTPPAKTPATAPKK